MILWLEGVEIALCNDNSSKTTITIRRISSKWVVKRICLNFSAQNLIKPPWKEKDGWVVQVVVPKSESYFKAS